MVDIVAEPIVPAWTSSGEENTLGVELQRAIMRGFGDPTANKQPYTFEKVFTFKEHGEFFRGALTMASLRYAGDFYEKLKQYEKIKVTITRELKEDR